MATIFIYWVFSCVAIAIIVIDLYEDGKKRDATILEALIVVIVSLISGWLVFPILLAVMMSNNIKKMVKEQQNIND